MDAKEGVQVSMHVWLWKRERTRIEEVGLVVDGYGLSLAGCYAWSPSTKEYQGMVVVRKHDI